MDIKEIQVVDLKVTSIDQLIILYKQGFKLSETPYTDSNGNTIVKMSNGIIVTGKQIGRAHV